MTERNLKQELYYSYYEDMEDGRTTETIDYECLIEVLGELIDRVEGLETQIKDLAIARDYRNNLGL
jgi:hypothetical protein